MASSPPIVVLFGYESSTFTLKVRLALRLKQIPYTFVAVPSMMPRPVLRDNFHLTYRKIPVLAIGRELYCDTTLILEALEHFFPPTEGYQTLYPRTRDGRSYRALMRGFAAYWTDRALFRVTTGLIPARVWRSRFGQDRAQLIGHALDADKLARKLPENLARLDTQLSLLEPLLAPPSSSSSRRLDDDDDGDVSGTNGDGHAWLFSAAAPSLADIALFYQLQWGSDIAAGRGVADLTGGGAAEGGDGSSSGGGSDDGDDDEGTDAVFNARRYPGLYAWFRRMQLYFRNLEDVEERALAVDEVLERMRAAPQLGPRSTLLPTPRAAHASLGERTGLTEGALVSIAPDDTGRDEYGSYYMAFGHP